MQLPALSRVGVPIALFIAILAVIYWDVSKHLFDPQTPVGNVVSLLLSALIVTGTYYLVTFRTRSLKRLHRSLGNVAEDIKQALELHDAQPMRAVQFVQLALREITELKASMSGQDARAIGKLAVNEINMARPLLLAYVESMSQNEAPESRPLENLREGLIAVTFAHRSAARAYTDT